MRKRGGRARLALDEHERRGQRRRRRILLRLLCVGVPLGLASLTSWALGYPYVFFRSLLLACMIFIALTLMPDLGKVVPIHLIGRLAIMAAVAGSVSLAVKTAGNLNDLLTVPQWVAVNGTLVPNPNRVGVSGFTYDDDLYRHIAGERTPPLLRVHVVTPPSYF